VTAAIASDSSSGARRVDARNHSPVKFNRWLQGRRVRGLQPDRWLRIP